jgi:hypothetical protein
MYYTTSHKYLTATALSYCVTRRRVACKKSISCKVSAWLCSNTHNSGSTILAHVESRIPELYKEQRNSVVSVRERTIPTERLPLVGEKVPNFTDRGCHVVSVANPYGHILGILDRSRYFFIQVAPQLYSRG